MENKRNLIFIGAIILVCFLHFYQCLYNGFSIDDDFYIQQMQGVNNWGDLFQAFKYRFSVADYRPVSTFTFVVEYLLSGNEINPRVSHFVNLLIYILCGIVLFLFIDIIPQKLKSKYVAEIAVLLFISLPLHTSMIANIKSRDGLISFFLGFLYLYLITRLILFKGKLWKKLSLFVLAIAALFCSIFAKLDGFTFIIATPLLILLLIERVNIKNLLRFSVVSIILYRSIDIIYQFWNQKRVEAIPLAEDVLSDPVFFTENPIVNYDQISYKLAFSIQTVFEYIIMTFKPDGHYFYYGFDMIPVLPLTNPIIILKGLVIVILGLIAIFLYNKNRFAAFGIAFFFVGLLYCCNFITPASGIVADRYAFIASAGACIVLASLLNWITNWIYEKYIKKRKSDSKPKFIHSYKFISFIPVIGLSLFYLPFNIERCKDWRTRITLFDSDLPSITTKSYEANRIAIRNYVETAIDSNDETFRKKYFSKAVEYGNNAVNLYDGQIVQEGIIMGLYGLNLFDSAVAVSRSVISKFDTTEVGWRILTEYYNFHGYLDSAAIGYRNLIKLMPEDEELYYFYTTTLFDTGKKLEAYQYLDTLQHLNPDHHIAYKTRFFLCLNDKDTLKAMENLELAMERGWRDNKVLDFAGVYWWHRDRVKWEYLKQFHQ